MEYLHKDQEGVAHNKDTSSFDVVPQFGTTMQSQLLW